MNSVISEIPRIYTSIAEWGACIVYIAMLPKRFKMGKTIVVSLLALVIQSIFMVVTGDLSILFWLPSMLAAILLMFFFIYLSGQISVRDAAYYCIRAFVLAELVASLERQIYWFFWPQNNAALIMKVLMVAVVYATTFILIWKLERRHFDDDPKNLSSWELVEASIIGITVFFISNISFVSANTPFSSQYPEVIIMLRTLVDIGGYTFLYAHHIQCGERRIRKEMEALHNVVHNQYVQYKLSRESVDLINRKYHDLKHQIGALRAENDPTKREEWLDSIENDLKNYEAQHKTGNAVLDTILTSKALYCQKYDIDLTCVINGSLMNFMDVRDICSIFGNALDNAIEHVSEIADKDKRMIHVLVFQKKQFLILKFENYFEGELKLNKGLPITTKKDTVNHGYGLKSINVITQKYNGVAKVYTEGQWFELDLVFPLPT